MRLKGKIGVVTGAGAGMGRAVALRYAREGAYVVLAEVQEESGCSVLAEIGKAGGQARLVRVDVSAEDDLRELAHVLKSECGTVDILYNNAAVLFHKSEARAHELSSETWDITHNVNLRGAWLCSKYVIPLMLGNSGGSIIHVSSPTGLIGCGAALTAYSASKGGLIALTRVMANDYAKDGIRVNTIIPGTMDTPMNQDIMNDEAVRSEYRKNIPLGRLGTSEDITGLAVFLASDDSAYCTGGIYMADGGLTAI